jgi:hypothetical protein
LTCIFNGRYNNQQCYVLCWFADSEKVCQEASSCVSEAAGGGGFDESNVGNRAGICGGVRHSSLEHLRVEQAVLQAEAGEQENGADMDAAEPHADTEFRRAG